MNTAEKVNLLNEYHEGTGYNDDIIYPFDEYTFRELFSDPWDAMRSTVFGDVNFSHDYFTFNGYGNLETLSDWEIDDLFNEPDFQEWAKENDRIESDED